ncbi:MAG: TIM barrel protein [Ruminococcaceae bacterium]|jgi:xylose isomerase|nr:TIM barrel protein [Oscillospiraceae bacterium]
MSGFKFSVGPWNVHEGADAFGPDIRPAIAFADKLATFRKIGFDAVQFHDDDAVPEINGLREPEIIARARDVRKMLDDNGLAAEFVAPRLWMDKRTADGGYTSNCPEDRAYAMWRSFRSIDIANELGCDKIVLWLAREGTLCAESKDTVVSIRRLVDAVNKMLAYDPKIKILIEPKPNEPIDRSFCGTMGHVMAVSAMTDDPSRVGGLLESAHAILAGLDPANEMAFALAMGKLWGVHLNDQNGMKYDQDKTFGAENLRQAFNQIRVLKDHGYGSGGEYIGLDVKAMRTQPVEISYRHLENSLNVVRLLEEKVDRFDRDIQKKLIEARDYEALEMVVLQLLLKG